MKKSTRFCFLSRFCLTSSPPPQLPQHTALVSLPGGNSLTIKLQPSLTLDENWDPMDKAAYAVAAAPAPADSLQRPRPVTQDVGVSAVVELPPPSALDESGSAEAQAAEAEREASALRQAAAEF